MADGDEAKVSRADEPGRPGGERLKRRPTINDIARLANVSKKTVSRVINRSPHVREATRVKINSIIDELGFEPDPQARGLALRRSFLIGLVYDNPNAQYIVHIQQGMLDALRGTGFELVVHPCAESNSHFIPDVLNFIERQKLFGVVLLPPVAENDILVEHLRDIDCPYVRIACLSLEPPKQMIVSRDKVGAAEAADHLASNGHTRIGFISGPANYRSSAERRAGFSEALAARGIKLDPALTAQGAYSFESGIQCGTALLTRNPRPTAIFASNDEMAAGVYWAAHQMGLRIPDDISVVGYDDSPLALRLWPPLTTVRSPIPQMGQFAAERLLARYRSETKFDPIEVVPRLVARDSVGKVGK